MKLLFVLVEAMSFCLLVAYAYSKSPAFRPLRPDALRWRDRLFLFGFFAALSITGTYLGLPVRGAIANTRAIGPVLAGILGGPLLGGAVGLAGGLHRLALGGFTAFACGLSTTVEGLVGGLVHLYVVRRSGPERVFDPKVVFATTFAAEALQMAIILLVARPYQDAVALVQVIALPMMTANSAGAAFFMSILRDRMKMVDRVGAASGARALRIAERSLGHLTKGLDREGAREIARIIHEETGVGAVAITDTEQVLAFVGEGSDHHRAGAPIASEWTRRAIAASEVTFVDGMDEPYRCALSKDCPLRSVLVVPLHVAGDVVGTVKLYEPASKRFLESNRSLGEGLTSLLSGQLVRARYQEQKSLLVMAELKLARAQVNPHFLFNALNTVMAMLEDGSRPRALLAHLSSFFRKNLKRVDELSTLREELEHVSAYLEIEKARFEDRLSVEVDVDPTLLEVRVPTFTLQPLVENAIKHGISDMLAPGTARIHAYRQDGAACIDVEDDAGAYEERRRGGNGLGLQIVEKRLRILLGREAGLAISCTPGELTRVSIRVPAPTPAPAPAARAAS
jgi:two-component system, LytTR family, sensor kinase